MYILRPCSFRVEPKKLVEVPVVCAPTSSVDNCAIGDLAATSATNAGSLRFPRWGGAQGRGVGFDQHAVEGTICAASRMGCALGK